MELQINVANVSYRQEQRSGAVNTTNLANQAPMIAALGDTFMQSPDDRDYILSVFSGILSFAALIVALVALFKGVG